VHRSAEKVPNIDALTIAPLIVVHIAIFLLPRNVFAEVVYMLGYVASLAVASTRGEYRHLLLIPAAGLGIGLVVEILGVSTGIPFGRYEYVSLVAPRVFGVPISVPVMWGFYAYLTYLIASSIVRCSGVARAVYASLLMVGLDLAMDPFMVNEINAWTWLGGWGPRWFGVPASNFVGWFVVSLAIFLIHETAARDARMPRAYVLAIPYACLLMFFASHTDPELADSIAALIVTLLAIPALIASFLSTKKD